MAVRAPTTVRVCLNCKLNSDANAGKEFHKIFDEVGLELQLPFLVKTFFHIDLNKDDNQHLCDECVNSLIVLYDLDEHTKEESCKTNHLKNKPESRRMPKCSNSQEISKYFKNDSGNFRDERENVNKPFVIGLNSTRVTLPNSNSTEEKDRTKFENFEDVRYFFNKNRSEPFTEQQDFSDEDFNQPGQRKVSQDFNISLLSSAIKVEKTYELESNEHMEFISDDETQNVEINKKSNANIMVQQHSCTMANMIPGSNEKIEVLSEIKSETNENIFLDSDQNEFYEEKVCEEFINSGDSNSLLEELQITEENEALLLNASSSVTEFNNKVHYYADDIIEQEAISDDSYSVKKEYLVEEIILSEEYDQVDLNEYLDNVLITKFQDLQLNCEMECKLCLKKYYSFVELLNHACMAEFEKEQKFFCIIKDCEGHANDLPTLARHLVLKHCDKLESTAIYGKCTDCQKIFSNVLDFNKHSCCPNIKRKNGAPNYCKYCDLDFQSLRRYVFHMQFHLKSHRPKICLLCGDLFNNSNDFFEHTQYKHNPKTALACVRCDRFFKDIQVFNNHMELHKDSKYQYECTLCPKKYTSKVGLNLHMDICHNNKPNNLQCKYCQKKFGYKRSYYNHIKTHDANAKVQTFICSTCGLITKNMEMMKDHIESDNKSPCFSSPVDKKILGFGYLCENCSLDFFTIKHLKEHRLSDRHSDELFHCGMCKKSFNTFHGMRNHSIKQTECKEWQESFPITRYFVCNIGDCQEFYSIWASFYCHKQRPHKTEEKANSPTEFKCQFCQQLYNSKKSLTLHIAKSHTNANIKCSDCNKSFKSQNILQKHIYNKHTLFECDICLKKFKSRRNLDDHISSVHNNIKRFSCKHCQKRFVYRKQRKMHEKKVHPQL